MESKLKKSPKKSYQTPRLRVYGDVSEITKGVTNAAGKVPDTRGQNSDTRTH